MLRERENINFDFFFSLLQSGELTADDVKTAEKIVKRVEQLVDALKQVFGEFFFYFHNYIKFFNSCFNYC